MPHSDKEHGRRENVAERRKKAIVIKESSRWTPALAAETHEDEPLPVSVQQSWPNERLLVVTRKTFAGRQTNPSSTKRVCRAMRGSRRLFSLMLQGLREGIAYWGRNRQSGIEDNAKNAKRNRAVVRSPCFRRLA
jgi:hypothetical protein